MVQTSILQCPIQSALGRPTVSDIGHTSKTSQYHTCYSRELNPRNRCWSAESDLVLVFLSGFLHASGLGPHWPIICLGICKCREGTIPQVEAYKYLITWMKATKSLTAKKEAKQGIHSQQWWDTRSQWETRQKVALNLRSEWCWYCYGTKLGSSNVNFKDCLVLLPHLWMPEGQF